VRLAIHARVRCNEAIEYSGDILGLLRRFAGLEVG